MFFPKSAQAKVRTKKRRPVKQNFFAAWDDNEKLEQDLDAFDLLAERGFETLPDYQPEE